MSNLLRMSYNWLIIPVTGITGGGKSELCTYLYQNLPNTTRILRQDEYFLSVDSPKHVMCPNGIKHFNWDVISCIDMEQMFLDIQKVITSPPSAKAKQKISYANMVVVDKDADSAVAIGQWDKSSVSHDPNDFGEKLSEESPPEDSRRSQISVSSLLTNSSENPLSDPTVASNGIHSSEKRSNVRPVLILDGFTVLDEPRILEISDQVYFFELTKEECFSRREARNYDPPDVPGYFEHCVYPMYEEYRERCNKYAEKVPLRFLDGASEQEKILRSILVDVKKSANLV